MGSKLFLTGTSMGRWLQNRTVEIEPAEPGSLVPGDLIVYQKNGKKLLHRLWVIENGVLLVRDDVAALDLHPVAHEEILGRPTGLGWKSKGKTGFFYSWASNKAYWLKRALKRAFS